MKNIKQPKDINQLAKFIVDKATGQGTSTSIEKKVSSTKQAKKSDKK